MFRDFCEGSATIVQSRTKNGDFKELDGLKKVPGVNAKLIEGRKDRATFRQFGTGGRDESSRSWGVHCPCDSIRPD
jgi:hypothetical protein